MQKICDNFNKYDFHDSKLISFKLIRKELGNGFISEDICFTLKLLERMQEGRTQLTNAKLILKDCRIIKMDIDLVGKRLCADDIANAKCEINSDLKSSLQSGYLKYEEGALNDYLHFNITLIPPGGTIDILAKKFELELIKE
jgi:hypothetical protein